MPNRVFVDEVVWKLRSVMASAEINWFISACSFCQGGLHEQILQCRIHIGLGWMLYWRQHIPALDSGIAPVWFPCGIYTLILSAWGQVRSASAWHRCRDLNLLVILPVMLEGCIILLVVLDPGRRIGFWTPCRKPSWFIMARPLLGLKLVWVLLILHRLDVARQNLRILPSRPCYEFSSLRQCTGRWGLLYCFHVT